MAADLLEIDISSSDEDDGVIRELISRIAALNIMSTQSQTDSARN